MTNILNRLVKETDGQDLIEYGLLLGIVAVGAITFISTIGTKVKGYFSNMAGNLP